MLQNVYSLPDLIDLALTVPEIGAINFNILHIVLHTIVKELNMTDVRPWCHLENPLLAKTALTKSKLKEAAQRRTISLETLSEEVVSTRAVPKTLARSTSDDSLHLKDRSKSNLPSMSIQQKPSPERTKKSTATVQTEAAVSDDVPAKPPNQKDTSTQAGSDETAKDKPCQTDIPSKDSAVQAEIDRDFPKPQERRLPEAKVQIPAAESTRPYTGKDRQIKKDRANEEIPTDILLPQPPVVPYVEDVAEDSAVSSDAKRTGKKTQRAGDAWKYTNLSSRVEGTEEGLHRLSNIVDIIADKMKKSEQRKKEGGPESEELEAIDDRILELEEAFTKFAEDHDILTDVQSKLDGMLSEFEGIKMVGAQIKEMDQKISKKANREETEAALALKGDLKLVNTKVDQMEFETAIEESGEAIGLLGLKFTRKNEEWEESTAEIWRRVEGKMSRDIFDKGMAKVQSRVTALMFGVRKLKKVVEDLLYPESGGVTRCILCRRPACIAGLECLGGDSPKRPLSSRTSDGDEAKKLEKTLEDIVVKRQRLDEPPYCQSRDTILSLPYSSSSYGSSVDDQQEIDRSSMKIVPISPDAEFNAARTSQVPKLPDINDSRTSCNKPARWQAATSKSKSRRQQAELIFTNKLLTDIQKEETDRPSQKHEKCRYIAGLEEEGPPSSSNRSSSKSSTSSVYILPDPSQNTEDFAPARMMQDMMRRTVLLSPSSQKQQKQNLALDPMLFNSPPGDSSQSSRTSDTD